jgi:hypothetical protein
MPNGMQIGSAKLEPNVAKDSIKDPAGNGKGPEGKYAPCEVLHARDATSVKERPILLYIVIRNERRG